jgi:hypothetical protein
LLGGSALDIPPGAAPAGPRRHSLQGAFGDAMRAAAPAPLADDGWLWDRADDALDHEHREGETG